MNQRSSTKRLVKVLLEADLVRRMDRRILASGGAYQDRGEFVAEAIVDRLTDEEALIQKDEDFGAKVLAAADSSAVADEPRPKPQYFPVIEPPLDDSVVLGAWRNGGPLEGVPVEPTDSVNFGLHNRDLPTLWALDRLVTLVGKANGPVAWSDFVAGLRKEGAHAGALLRQRDLAKPTGLRAGIGFPKPGLKKEASIDRFITAAVGGDRRTDGPFFVLALAGFTDEEHTRIAPTRPALKVLHDMLERGLGPILPQPPAALESWWRFISSMAPAEHAAWRKVLRVVADEPTRDELIVRFPEWRGHVATTNTVGFISRSREWGLVQPELIDGRYLLTELGAAVAQEG